MGSGVTGPSGLEARDDNHGCTSTPHEALDSLIRESMHMTYATCVCTILPPSSRHAHTGANVALGKGPMWQGDLAGRLVAALQHHASNSRSEDTKTVALCGFLSLKPQLYVAIG